MTSSNVCASPNPALSNLIIMTVGDPATPSVSISASATTICSGTSVTFTANPINEGSAPLYQWRVNGINQGSNSSNNIFSSSTLTNGSVVSVILTSDAACRTKDTASARIAMTVNPNPTVNVGAAVAAICQGGTTTALGGSFGGSATGAVWSDGGTGGTFTNNSGSTPSTATYIVSATAPLTVTLTLTTTGGSCGTVSASNE